MGGYVAFQFARKYPQRLRALVLCNTRSAADTPEARQSRLNMVEQVLAVGPAHGCRGDAAAIVLRRNVSSGLPGAVEFVRERILLTPPEGIAAALRGLAERPDVTGLLSQLSVPTLVVAGSDDVITPASEMREMAAGIANSEFVVLPGVGHLSALEAPVEFNAMLARFLAQRVRRGTRRQLDAFDPTNPKRSFEVARCCWHVGCQAALRHSEGRAFRSILRNVRSPDAVFVHR